MSVLAKYAILMGAILAPLYGVMILAPHLAMLGLKRFPRSRIMGAVLSVIGFAWAGWLLHQTPMGRFEQYRAILYALLPVICILVNILNSELLAPRALGGIMMLVPAPLLAAARWHPSPWRYLVIVMAYILVLKGVALILSPYVFRRSGERIVKTESLCRAWGGFGMAMAILLIVLGITIY
ncbi:MAG: hypothetical protein QGH42_12450 [Kiritimatiellia bacterium]|jgi:hypothetical protein|nr:hypothetical protein [Kiritimatiellia bacterium]MDP6809945.1 hypothetical protein [Kiritimatiellia bacterium]MDP7025035.1 hypothetical protein [Kiritimatiellia bacterium]